MLIICVLSNYQRFTNLHRFYPVFAYLFFRYVRYARNLKEKKKRRYYTRRNTHLFFFRTRTSVTEIYSTVIFLESTKQYKIPNGTYMYSYSIVFLTRTRGVNELVSFEIEEVNRIPFQDISRYLERRGSANKHRITEARGLMDDSLDGGMVRCEI